MTKSRTLELLQGRKRCYEQLISAVESFPDGAIISDVFPSVYQVREGCIDLWDEGELPDIPAEAKVDGFVRYHEDLEEVSFKINGVKVRWIRKKEAVK